MPNTTKYYLAKAREFIGTKFGKLTVLELAESCSKNRRIRVKCICECGNTYTQRLSLLKRGSIQSCGCLLIDARLQNIKKAHKVQFKREPKLASAKKIYDHNYKDGDLSFEEFVELSQLNCFYCGIAPTNTFNVYTSGKRYKKFIYHDRMMDGYFTYNGLDRVDNLLGHDKNNVVTCCWDCNRAKLERTKEGFIIWAHRICQLHPIIKV